MFKLKNWSIGTLNPYYPSAGHVSGEVYDNPRFDDGYNITTSRIQSVDGNVVTTESGSQYELVGDPSPEYVQWLKDNGEDHTNPLPYFK